ncbi:MAG: hypothetical protein ACK508_03285 [Lysobacteraceae bacterium]|jgi:hypothetical protein|uniref:hypothetical protein n=1 Tax=Silanimonas sp. TaxID=1929290 RepID=UPI0022CCB867|nr:hypothetical protein [Silanimonas sp.]MCZ8115639.1 hypothetical protein [Silanimonas sp.]
MTTRKTVFASVIASLATSASLLFLTGASDNKARYDEIDVGRINIREPDGTLRMVIANRAQFPGSPWRGGEVPRPDRDQFAGMLFINDEGTENGGLIQKGVIGPDGKVSAGLSLTFDRFRQDQVVQLLHAENGGRAFSTLAINDEADGTQFDVMQRAERMKAIEALPPDQRQAAFEEMQRNNQLSRNRIRLGTTMDGGAALSLADPQGRPRMMLLVSSEGQPSIVMFDDKGEMKRMVELDGSDATRNSDAAAGSTP